MSIRRFYRKTKADVLEPLDHQEEEPPSGCPISVLNFLGDKLNCTKEPDNEFIEFCLSSYSILGDETYSDWGRTLGLIPMSGFNFGFQDLNFTSGMNEKYNKLIRLKFELIHKQDKFCTVAMDEIKLETENDSGGHVGGVPSHQAKFATCFSIRGLFADWNIPVAFYLCSKPAKVAKLKSRLFQIIKTMEDFGLEVQAVIARMTGNIYELSQHLIVSPESQTFSINGKTYYFIFDPYQLMNITLKNLIKYEMRFENFRATWKHVEHFHSECDKRGIHCILDDLVLDPDLDDDVLEPEDSIDYLSEELALNIHALVLQGFLPKSVEGTPIFMAFFSKVFQFMNSSETSSKYSEPFTSSRSQMKLLKGFDTLIDTLHVYNKNKNITEKVKFIKAWKVNIHALPKLYNNLKEKLKFEHNVPSNNYLFTSKLTYVFPSLHTPYPASLNDIPASLFVKIFKTTSIVFYLHVSLSQPITQDEYFQLISKKVPKRYLSQHSEGAAETSKMRASTSKNEASTSKV